MAQDWYYRMLGEEFGPFTFAALRDMVQGGHLTRDVDVRTSTSRWRSADQVLELFETGDVEEPELATDMDLDLLLAPSSSQTVQLSPKRKAQKAAVAAATRPAVQWYYKLFEQEMGPVSQEDILRLVRDGSLHGEDDVRQGASGAWKRLDKTPQFVAISGQMKPKPEWYCRLLGQELGPMTFDELQQMAKSGALHADDDVRHGESDPWTTADRTRGLKFPKTTAASAASRERTSTLAPFGDAAKKREWDYEILGQQMGPISFREMAKAVANGTLTLEDKARRGKAGLWTLILDVPGLVSTEDKAAYIAAKLEAKRPQPLTPPPPVAVPVAPAPVVAAAVPLARPVPTAAPAPERFAYEAAGHASGGYGSMASASRTPAPPPRPAFHPSKKSSGPAFDFGAFFGDLQEHLDGKAIAALGAILLIGGYFGAGYFGIRLFGQPGSAEFEKVNAYWMEIQTIHDAGNTPGAWDAFAAKHSGDIEALAKQINAQHPSADTVLLQSMLFCTRDHLPGVLKPTDQQAREARYTVLEQSMADATRLAGR